MPIKFCHFMRNLVLNNKTIIFLFCIFTFNITKADPPIEDPSRTFLQLSKNTWLYLKRISREYDKEKFELQYGRGKGNEAKKDIIWSKIFQTDESRAWEYAYFLRLKPGRFVYDLDDDGDKEFGISTYDMGNNMIREVLIFSIRKDQIVFLREYGPYNIAADEPAF